MKTASVYRIKQIYRVKQLWMAAIGCLYSAFVFPLDLNAESPKVVAPVTAAATTAPAPAPTANLPKSGSLSRSFTGVHGNRSVSEPIGGIDVRGTDPAPISGSCSKITPRKWRMKVFNNSEETFSVNVEVEQRSSAGARLKGDSFSYTLAPGKSEERDLAAYANTADCVLNLKSWKRVGGK